MSERFVTRHLSDEMTAEYDKDDGSLRICWSGAQVFLNSSEIESLRRLLNGLSEPDEREQLQADIATAEKNLKELANTSERYSGELDQPIGELVAGIARARARLAEIEKEI